MERSVIAPFEACGGRVGFYFKDLVTGEELASNAGMPLMAASVIKLPVMAEAFRQMEEGIVSADERFVIREEDKLPSCGALNELHDGVEVTFMDAVRLMIVLSDNTATNMVIKRIGADAVNRFIQGAGLRATRLNRLLFDEEASARGVENTISAGDMGRLLELIFLGKAVSKAASREMLGILFDQKLNDKLPLPLPRETEVAHKTGEDDGITHDVGIVMGAHPYIICCCANGVDEPTFDMAIHKVSRAVYDRVR